MATLYKPSDVQIDGSGRPMAGAKLYFYTTGTSTPQDTYSDSGLTTPNANPVVADANGLWPPIYLGTTNYKAILKTSAGVTVQTIDPVLVNPQAASLSSQFDSQFGSTAASLLQRGAGGLGWVAATTKTVLDNKFGSAQGTIIYRGASDWAVLATPSVSSFLSHAGTGNNPAWTAREQTAYGYFTQSGGTVTTQKAARMTIARTATGKYTVTLNPAFPDNKYQVDVVPTCSGGSNNGLIFAIDGDVSRSTTQFGLVFGKDSAGYLDPDSLNIEVKTFS
jgi:hypothetical protein